MHISRSDFYQMRLGEFFEAMDAFRKEAEAGRIHTGNLVRGLASRIMNLFVSKKDRIKDESKFWPMPWDEPQEAKADDVVRELAQMTDEQRQDQINDFLSRLGNGKRA